MSLRTIGICICLSFFSLPLMAVSGRGTHPELETAFSVAGDTPAAPTNLSIVLVGLNRVGLEWQGAVGNGIQFRIEQKTLDGAFEDIGGALDPTALIDGLQPDTVYIFRVRARNAAGDSGYSNELAVSTHTSRTPCVPGPDTLCIHNNRFRVKAYWETEQGWKGKGTPVKLTADSGYFWFFQEENVEMVVKVLNGCGLTFSYWVYAGGLTDQKVIWTVTDTAVGFTKTYTNPLKDRFAPVTDVAFNPTGCP